MKDYTNILNIGKYSVKEQSKAIANLEVSINTDFEKTVKTIIESEGRVVITGIGKSAIIANKIVATLNSTGTPSIFMHAADAIHGDLGIVQKNDVVICISKSGNTPEIKVLVPLIKNSENILIGMTGNTSSFLGTHSNFVLNTYVKKEVCPNNLAPTTSTTVQLVMGDALAVALLDVRKFTNQDFAKYHPGGALGKRLYLRVSDLIKNNEAPQIHSNDNVSKVILEITEKRLGVTAVINDNKLVGVVTDGDIRRMLNKTKNIANLTAKDIMGVNPITISENAMAVKALEVLETNNITQVLVINDQKDYVGIVHLHDLLKEGII